MIVYKITNKINGKIYIGQTICKLNRRMANHLSRQQTPIEKAITKYGIESFEICVIDHASDKETLNEKEIYWINTFNCKAPFGYNLTDGGEGRNGVVVSTETRDRLSEANKNRGPMPIKTRLKISNANKGRVVSRETRKKLSVALTGKKHSDEHNLKVKLNHARPFKGKKFTDEHKKHLSDSIKVAKGKK